MQNHAIVRITIRKRKKERPLPKPWTPTQQCEKLTYRIQRHEPHALVTTSGAGCFYLLHEAYVADGVRNWSRAQLLGDTYARAAETLNRLYGESLDPVRGNSWV